MYSKYFKMGMILCLSCDMKYLINQLGTILVSFNGTKI